jgi:hypothetical protein
VDAQEPKLEWAKLQQDRELKDRELTLKEKELELQQRQGSLAKWSTPAVAAIIAGLIGYIGTLISSHQSRQLEREKQESTLILEVIKTTGTAEERERQTAANLVFFADAGLITSIKSVELEKLRVKAQGAGPSLPAPQGVEFKKSSVLTSALQSKLQAALLDYQAWLGRIGYNPGQAGAPAIVRVDEETRDNAYFDNESVVLGVNLAGDPEYLLSEYTWYILKQSNRSEFDAVWQSAASEFQGFAYGLKFYFTCSYLNDPRVGKNYYVLVKSGNDSGKKPYLFNLADFRAFEPGNSDASEPHKLGEVWGGAFWEVRNALSPEKADRIILDAWKRLQPTKRASGMAHMFVEEIVKASKIVVPDLDPQMVRQAFTKRKLGN